MYRIGIDIGATNMRVGLFDPANQLVAREQSNTEATSGATQALEKLVRMIEAVDPERLASGIGIGAPGPLDVDNGIILDAPNLPGWHGFRIRDELESRAGKTVFLMNDAKVAALAEAKIGAGAGYSSVQYITVSTGVGGGLVCDGELFAGSHQHASELGNMIVDVSLKNGTLEDLCSGTSLKRESQVLFGKDKTATDLFMHYDAYHPEARRVVACWLQHFGAALTSIIQVIDPEVFVLGGAVILHNPWLVEELKTVVAQRVYGTMKETIQLKVASLGDDAGLYGAAMLVR
ncbi:ROK family protein [Listeria booriae]|uniref:ROK family protein n=1 Tax=Listeria booriae TaxID=1552123 RepID=UPI00162A62AB|nr:ROK family protein [Listeria booriae]MBC1943377.1 ROK family protein [Listeria booriae]MBC6163807.1 ROK family protein [Listeria booriae]MBC6166126.1 ROK family protein [Listeria booriae]